MCVGHTLGEEIVFRAKPMERRTESIQAKQPSCVLQVSIKIYEKLQWLRDRMQPNGVAYKDYVILKYILENHFIQKNEWREQAGIYENYPKVKLIEQKFTELDQVLEEKATPKALDESPL